MDPAYGPKRLDILQKQFYVTFVHIYEAKIMSHVSNMYLHNKLFFSFYWKVTMFYLDLVSLSLT